MALAFPGIILYGTALFAEEGLKCREKQRRVCHGQNAFDLIQWIAPHLFYIMILTPFAWLNRRGTHKRKREREPAILRAPFYRALPELYLPYTCLTAFSRLMEVHAFLTPGSLRGSTHAPVRTRCRDAA